MSALRAARARLGRRGRRLGSRRDAVPPASRGHRGRDLARAAAPPDGWEVFVSTAFAGRVDGRPRADLLAELVSASALDRRRRRARQDDDERDDRLLPRPARPRPGVPHRRRDPAARRQRARGGGLARRRGRRVRPLGRRAAARDRRPPQRRPRPPRDVRLARRGRGVLRGVARAACRRSCAPRSSSRSTLELARAGRAQPPERRGGARRARARRRRRAPTPSA